MVKCNNSSRHYHPQIVKFSAIFWLIMQESEKYASLLKIFALRLVNLVSRESTNYLSMPGCRVSLLGLGKARKQHRLFWWGILIKTLRAEIS